jgi:Ricin-type beta-trefoil lectin domain
MSTSEFGAVPRQRSHVAAPFFARMLTVLAAAVIVCFSSGWLSATALAATAGAGPTPTAVVKCLEDSGDSRQAGADVVVAGCASTAAQHWTWAGSTLRINGLCLSAVAAAAQLQPCGGVGQQWADKGTELVAVQSGQCLTDPGNSTVDGTALDLEKCNGSAAQRWALPGPSSSAALTWGIVAVVALLLIGLLLLFSLNSAAQRRVVSTAHWVRALFPRRKRRLSPAVAALLTDSATSRDAVSAMEAVGRGNTWWPYAAVVSTDDATVWLAGLDIPAPGAPWRAVPGDSRAWTTGRTKLAAARPDAEPGAPALELCPAVLGVLDDGVVVVDVSMAHGVLVIEGDERMARLVQAAAEAQLEGGEVLVRGTGPHPAAGRSHWTVEVDEDGWIEIHGRLIEFTETPGLAVLESVLVDSGHPAVEDAREGAPAGSVDSTTFTAVSATADVTAEPAFEPATAIAQTAPTSQAAAAPATAPKSEKSKTGPATKPAKEKAPVVEPGEAIAGVGEAVPDVAVPAVSAVSTSTATPPAAQPPLAAEPDAEPEPEEDEDDEGPVDLGSIAVSSAPVGGADAPHGSAGG